MAITHQTPLSEGSRVLIVAGSKGGVGTSTVALNFSVQLAQSTKKRVALLDYARPFGQISLMLDLAPRFTLLDALERVARLDAELLASLTVKHKSGIDILAGPTHTALNAVQRQSVTIESLARVIQMASQAFDFVVMDTGFVNAAEWSLVLRAAHSVLLVTEPSVLALALLDRYLAAAKSAGLDPALFQIVVNRVRQSDDEMLSAFEKSNGRSILMRLPNDYRQLTEVVKLAMPLAGSSSNLLVARYRQLANLLAGPTLSPTHPVVLPPSSAPVAGLDPVPAPLAR